MSSDITPDVPRRIRCEAIESPSTSLNPTCHRSHGTVLRYPGSGPLGLPNDDPAFLIGLTLGHVRQGAGLTGTVPDTVIKRLQAQAGLGNPACRLLLDWLAHRNRDLVASSRPDPSQPHRTQHCLGRRLIRERRQAGPGSLKKRTALKAGSSGPKTAIIAAMKEGRADE
ncbi:hypothetical protein [Rhizobium sp. SSA_523]|uniref:hypothetical protein n=1 Tax=Rhizobium sp. SSA_523 TaxID=2952477 RepID=UPI002091A6C2|nr:hypothetical protein [Rhizobium sp. SSA_523]MCO5734445.1 hypothetical protein [Rhizobium sp. SSA_523]WKC23304.1 hypothetical protein QTJ18_21175 [Rhizobium sp. SSA_523]